MLGKVSKLPKEDISLSKIYLGIDNYFYYFICGAGHFIIPQWVIWDIFLPLPIKPEQFGITNFILETLGVEPK